MPRREPLLYSELLDFSRRQFVVVIADTLEAGYERFKESYSTDKLPLPDCSGTTALCVVHPNAACLLLFTFKKLSACVILHEVTHATNAMFSHIGIALDNGSDEAYAYHNEMLFRKVAQLLKDNNIRIPLLPV